MEVIDLSHYISESMPVYPGTEPPAITAACTIAKDGFAEKLLAMYSHTGTHMDAPGHILPGAPTLDLLEIGRFAGPGIVVDVTRVRGRIEKADLAAYEEGLAKSEFALLRADWSRYWGQAKYFEGYPTLSEDATRWLAGLGLKGIGLDSISIDPVDTVDYPNHKIVFARGMVVVENLDNLAALEGKRFVFVTLPLKLEDCDGSPVRAAALVE